MKKALFIIIPIVSLAIIWAVIRHTHTFDYFKISTKNMEPTYKMGDVICASRFNNYQLNSVVCYRSIHQLNVDSTPEIHVGRISGLEGQTIEMKNGRLFVDEVSKDNLNYLKFSYKIAVVEFEQNQTLFDSITAYQYTSSDTLLADLSQKEISSFNGLIHPTILIHQKNKIEDQILGSTVENKWNADNMGPLQVPKGYVFILGDNRENSFDSRYKRKGFIKKEDVIAVAF